VNDPFKCILVLYLILTGDITTLILPSSLQGRAYFAVLSIRPGHQESSSRARLQELE
jgi:hypothetical protein